MVPNFKKVLNIQKNKKKNSFIPKKSLFIKNVYNNFKWRFNWGNKKKKLENIEEAPEPDNVDSKGNNNNEELVIDSEADKFLVLIQKIFSERHIEQENITDDLDSEDCNPKHFIKNQKQN